MMSQLLSNKTFALTIAPDQIPEETVGACGRRLVWVPDSGGRLALAVEPSDRTAPPCSRCRRICPGHELFGEHEVSASPGSHGSPGGVVKT